MIDLEKRYDEVIHRIAKIEMCNAVGSERHNQTIRRLDAIDNHLSWMIKIVTGGVLGALITFIIKGGLVL